MTSICPHCHKPIRERSKFCPACGGTLRFGTLSPNNRTLPFALNPSEMSFGKLRMAATAKQEIRLTNIGEDRLEISLQPRVPWVQVITGPYILGPGKSQDISVQVNTSTLLRRGVYTSEIRILVGEESFALKVDLEIEPPFILNPADTGSGIASLTEMALYCDKHWKASVRLLDEGRLAACLTFLGETKAQTAMLAARTYPDPNIALEVFLRTIDSCRGRRPPTHNGSQISARLGFGLRGMHVRKPPNRLTLYIRNPNQRGYMWGEVHPLVNWLDIAPTKFSCAAGKTARLMVKVNVARWPRRKRCWSLGVKLYEVVLFDEKGQPNRHVKKTAAPGYGVFLSVVTAVFLLWAIVVIMFISVILGG